MIANNLEGGVISNSEWLLGYGEQSAYLLQLQRDYATIHIRYGYYILARNASACKAEEREFHANITINTVIFLFHLHLLQHISLVIVVLS